jgi:hypothetical protein
MFTNTTLALALVLATGSGALAAGRTHVTGQTQNIYNPTGGYVGTDPDINIRFELNRDATRGR